MVISGYVFWTKLRILFFCCKKRIEKWANNDNCNYDWKKDEVVRVMRVCFSLVNWPEAKHSVFCGVSASALWTGLKQNTLYSVVCLLQPCEPAWSKTQCILWCVCFSLVNRPEAKHSVFCGVSASALWTGLKQNTMYSVVCLLQPCEPAWSKTQCILWTVLKQNTMYSVNRPEAKHNVFCEPSWSKTQCILWCVCFSLVNHPEAKHNVFCEPSWSKTQCILWCVCFSLVNWPEAKHNLHLRYAEEFNSLVEQFLDKDA